MTDDIIERVIEAIIGIIIIIIFMFVVIPVLAEITGNVMSVAIFSIAGILLIIAIILQFLRG